MKHVVKVNTEALYERHRRGLRFRDSLALDNIRIEPQIGEPLNVQVWFVLSPTAGRFGEAEEQLLKQLDALVTAYNTAPAAVQIALPEAPSVDSSASSGSVVQA